MSPKKKRLAVPPKRAATHAARAVVHGGPPELPYPSVRGFLRAAALAAAGGLAVAGCADPVCSSSAIDELGAHGKEGIRSLTELELKAGLEQLGVGVGITPHPMPGPMPGAMMMPVPIYAPPPVPESNGEPEEPL